MIAIENIFEENIASHLQQLIVNVCIKIIFKLNTFIIEYWRLCVFSIHDHYSIVYYE